MLSSCTHLHRYRSHSIQVSLLHYCYVLSPPMATHYVKGCAPPHIAKRWPLTSRRVYVLGKGSGGGSSTRTARPPCALPAHLPPLPLSLSPSLLQLTVTLSPVRFHHWRRSRYYLNRRRPVGLPGRLSSPQDHRPGLEVPRWLLLSSRWCPAGGEGKL